MNRRTNDVGRTSFTPEEVCTLTMEFYRRNYIEGLFLSSGVLKSPDYTMELLYATLFKLRKECNFQGYIHVKSNSRSQSGADKTGWLFGGSNERESGTSDRRRAETFSAS